MDKDGEKQVGIIWVVVQNAAVGRSEKVLERKEEEEEEGEEVEGVES